MSVLLVVLAAVNFACAAWWPNGPKLQNFAAGCFCMIVAVVIT